MAFHWFLPLGATLAALAVALGAFGAHALKWRLAPEQLAAFQTAVQYQMIHALGLMLTALAIHRSASRWFLWGGWCLALGVLLFSGCIYLWLATGSRFLVHLVPVGGVSLIVGWIFLALGGSGRPR